MATTGFGQFILHQKIVLITGGGSGIGLAFVRLILSRGAKVIIGDLKLTPEAEKLVDASLQAHFVECDVTNWASLRNLVTQSIATFGTVPDIYIPCAGVFEPSWSNFWSDSEDVSSSYKTMRINVDHPIKLTRIAISALLGAEKKGVICLIGSGAGFRGFHGAALYAASKAAVINFATSMAELDPNQGIKVVCFCPAIVKSPLWIDRDQGDHWKRFFEDSDPANGQSPAEVARSMLTLIEDEEYPGGTVIAQMNGKEQIMHGGTSTDTKMLPDFVMKILSDEKGRPWVPER